MSSQHPAVSRAPRRRLRPLSLLLTGALLGSAVSAAPAVADTAHQEPAPQTPPAAVAASATEPTAQPQGAEEQILDVVGIESGAQPAPTVSAEELAAATGPTETIDFVAAGITWDADPANPVVDASMRVREDGTWSEWAALEVHPVPLVEGQERTGTDPLITTGADGVQISVSTENGTAPQNLQIALIDPGQAATDSTVAQTAQTRAASVPAGEPTARQAPAQTPSGGLDPVRVEQIDRLLRPAIVTRAQWGADESLATNTTVASAELKAMYIHHTASTNSYTRAQATQQLRSIYTYQAAHLNWGDVGYHFLVDKFGTVYEGRRGSLEGLVLGAQAGGFNTNTIGISALGNYEDAAAPRAMVQALNSVLAWQAARYGLDVTSTATLVSRASGGSTSKYPYGTSVRVPAILGHRDTNATLCPGRYLYAQLPTMRREVAAKVASVAEQIPNEPAAPSLPSGAYRLVGEGMQAQTSWNPVPGATHYQIMYRAQPHGGGSIGTQPWLAGRTTQGTSLTLSTDPGETAQFAVRAVNGTVPGPQTYLGQHTGPVSWADTSAVTRNGMSLVSHSRGVGRQALVSTRSGSSFTVRQASAARALTLSAQVPSGDVSVEVVRGNQVVGGMRFRAGGPSVCTLPISRAGDDIRVQVMGPDRIEFTAVAIPRAGQSGHAPATATPCQVSFVDNPYGSQYFDAVHWIQWSGISAGYGADNTFRKGRAISRGESLAFIHRYVAPEATGGTQSPFRDVPITHTFFDAVSWAVREGIARGYADGTYRPSQSVTRAEFASLFHRTVGTRGQDASAVSFPDVSRDSGHREAILWMASQGLITGYADGTFRPDRQITRGEVAVIMHRYASTTGIGI